MYAVYEIMVGRLGGLLARLEAVWGAELVELNAELRRVGLDEILMGGMRVSAGVGDQAMREVEAVWEGELGVVNAELRRLELDEIVSGPGGSQRRGGGVRAVWGRSRVEGVWSEELVEGIVTGTAGERPLPSLDLPEPYPFYSALRAAHQRGGK